MGKEKNEIPSFPDITPSSITESMFYEIESTNIKTEKDFQGLVQQMFEYPERDFYYFQEKDGPRNRLMLAKERSGHILMDPTEFFYYPHPTSKGYVRIEVHDGQYSWDWQREVVEKGPMFMRSTLRLSARTKRELETWHRLYLEDEFKKGRNASEHSFDVFISYASQDSGEADQIYDALIAAGGRAFLARKNLRPGEDFAEEIRQALISSRELWLLVSPSSKGSDWVISEWGAAWALGKKIVPILHRCGPRDLPDRLSKVQSIDFYKHPKLVADLFAAKPDHAGESPRRWEVTQTFTPDETAKLAELDEFMAWPAHRDSKQGFILPSADQEIDWLVFCESYEHDDSDPALRKRHMVLVHIDDLNVPRPMSAR